MSPSLMGTTWYRYVGNTTQEWWSDPKHIILLIEWEVVEESEKTVLLVRKRDVIGYKEYETLWIEKRRVLKEARKRFAYPTKALALKSFEQRLRWRIGYLERDLRDARAYEAGFALVKGLLDL